MTPLQLFQSGKLSEAIAASTQEVKSQPTKTAPRYLLAQLLSFAGQLERADAQLETILQQSPESGPGIALFRQLIRAEKWRQEFFDKGHAPELLADPPERLQLHLQASIALREGNDEEAATLLRAALESRPQVRGICDSDPFEDMIDPDDMTASFLEVYSSTGKYFWIPFENILQIEFRPIKYPRDLLWRSARLAVSNGPDGEVFLPTIYPASYGESDERLLLAHLTEWRGGDGRPVRGVGQRLLCFGEVDRPFLEISQIHFDPIKKAEQ